MTRTIIIPLDGSPTAERALPVGTWLAGDLDVELELLTTTFEDDESASETYLAELGAATGLPHVRTGVRRKVFPARGIIETVAARPEPVLCLTTHGRGALGEMFLGSVSDEVVRSVACPIVLVGPRCEVADAPASKEMVIAVDGSAGSLAVLPTAADWARRLQLAVHLVTVEEPSAPDRVRDPELNESLAMGRAVLDDNGVAATSHVLASAHPADVLLGYAAGLPAALFAMGTHGESGLAPSALGGVATRIVKQSAGPVLINRSSI